MRNIKIQNGSILVCAAFLLALCGSLAGLFFMQLMHTIKIVKAEIHAIRHDASDLTETLNSFQSAANESTAKYRCIESPRSQFSRGVALCFSSLAVGSTERIPQFIDFEILLKNVSECMDGSALINDITTSGLMLSKRAIIDTRTCDLSSTTELRKYYADGNLQSSSRLRIHPHNKENDGIIFALGYIDIPAGIELEDNLIIIAGGDLRVGPIKNLQSSAVKLTLISVSGVVISGPINGPLEYNAVGKLGVYSPPQVTSTENGLWPKTINVIPLSLTNVINDARL